MNNLKRIILIAAAGMFLGFSSLSASTPKIVVHRGYWKTEGSAQNSLASLVKADSVKAYASEFDVWITADSVCVVHHDAATKAGTNIETSSYADLMKEKLANGEKIPTLREYLAKAAELPDLRLVCELKMHGNRFMEYLAVDSILAMVDEFGLTPRTDYITFSRDAFRVFIEKAPEGIEVYYLSGDYLPEQIAYMKGAGIDYHIGALKKHPDWIEKCHELGLKVNVWTIDKPEDMRWCIDHGVDFITTNLPEELAAMLSGAGGR